MADALFKYLTNPIEVCIERDTKGFYEKNKQGIVHMESDRATWAANCESVSKENDFFAAFSKINELFLNI